MSGLLDGLNKAVSKLQSLGEKAADSAKELAGKASPELKEGLNKAAEGAKELYEKVSPEVKEGFNRAAEGAKGLYDKASPELKEGIDRAAEGAKGIAGKLAEGAKTIRDRFDAPGAPEPPKDLHAQIDAEVKEQIRSMREAALNSDDPIHAFFQAQRKARADEAQPEKPAETTAEVAVKTAEEAIAEAEALTAATGLGVETIAQAAEADKLPEEEDAVEAAESPVAEPDDETEVVEVIQDVVAEETEEPLDLAEDSPAVDETGDISEVEADGAPSEAPQDAEPEAEPASPLEALAEQARAAAERAQIATDALPGLLGAQAELLTQQVLDTAKRAGATLDAASDALLTPTETESGPESDGPESDA